MRVGDKLFVCKKKSWIVFEKHYAEADIEPNTRISPVNGTRVKFENGPHAGKEADFWLDWTDPKAPVSTFKFKNMGIVAFSELLYGEVFIVLSV